ncbi:cupin domain-containing protein [Plantibacter sp. CFBP 8798]|uniref:cupin domain-containing protein n=1 Tax=Plantibacter sp. CFBP 8798 TaxID=2775268 RepID=UPI00177CD496|nr:cupin domain-containing protein [Plantibacter sp. CFBP 8798]MBD8467849.1 cupin domain-containing protein [Plantibacter sp. CFBP 8798]
MTDHLLAPNAVLQGADVTLADNPLAPEDVVSGSPRSGIVTLTAVGDTEVGVWELGVGVVQDTEIDEVFVVLSGEATVDFADGTPSLELRPGSIGRLAAGARTTWTVRETLRKVYIA